jgi:hypothetical protein
MPISKGDQKIESLEEWQARAAPKSPHHWVDGRSAKEVARAWLASGLHLPQEVATLLEHHPAFGPVLTWEAEPEAKLRFDTFAGEPRNSDLAVRVSDGKGSYLLAVEAKADEPYGETVSVAFANALERRLNNPRSNGLARVEQLVLSLFTAGDKIEPQVAALRYQLLTATAAAVAEADRTNCSRAVMLVHEFFTDATKDENHSRNAADLSAFLRRLSGGAIAEAEDGKLYGPLTVPASPAIQLFIGKVVRRLRPSAA